MIRSILMSMLLFAALSVAGCAVTRAEPSPSRDGKCHGDYNAPSCIYLF